MKGAQIDVAAPDSKKFEDILEQHHLRLTGARKTLYSTLASYNRPVGMQRLTASLSTSMDPVTVYRNVEVFERIGIINKVYSGWKYRLELSEKFRPHHHHLTCQRCGQVVSLVLDAKIEQAIQGIGRRYRYKIIDHDIELTGLCKTCQ